MSPGEHPCHLLAPLLQQPEPLASSPGFNWCHTDQELFFPALLVPALALSPRRRVNIICAEPKYGVIYQFGRKTLQR